MTSRPRESAVRRPMAGRVLDVGCGGSKEPGAVGVDRLALPGVDIVHDLDVFPYPFDDDSFDRIEMKHVIEHLDDPLRAMVELHRIGRDGAIVHIMTPHYSCCDYYTDPTHKHPFSSRSFDYLIPGSGLDKYRYADAAYRKESLRLTVLSGFRPLDRLAEAVINRWQHPYELRLAWIFPAHWIDARLRIVKGTARR